MEPRTPAHQSGKWYPLEWVKLDRASGPPHTPAPLLRIHACGLLRVEVLCETRETPVLQGRYQSLSEEQMQGRNGAQALTLLKLLISRPHRHAPKQYLMEYLGHGEQAISGGRLDDLVTKLRGLLCIQEWEHLRTHLVQHMHSSAATGNGYRLALYPLIWLDTDALHSHIEHATRLERHSEPELACSYWERAYTLASCGDYLGDEQYADWAESKRAEVQRGRSNSVHALSRLLVATAGATGEAQVLHLLSTYCSRYPRDEDALRPLMELLGKHERFGEALSLYKQLCSRLADEGLFPDERTSDIAKVLRTKELHRQHLPLQPLQKMGTERALVDTSLFYSLNPHVFAVGMREREMVVHQESEQRHLLERRDSMSTESLSGLLALPTTTAHLLHEVSLFAPPIDQESITHFAQIIEVCYRLSEGNELRQAETILWSFLPRLESVVKYQVREPQVIARLVCQAYLLAASLAGHRNDLHSRLFCSEQALLYGEIAQDETLLVAAFRQLATTFNYLKLPHKVMQTYQRALPHLTHVPPLLQCCIYAALSGVCAKFQQKQDADHFLGLAYESFGKHQGGEPAYLLAINASENLLLHWQAKNLLELGQPSLAEKVFLRIDVLDPQLKLPKRIRIEAINNRARMFVAVGNMEQACTYLEAALDLAAAIGSRLRFEEVAASWNILKTTWPSEKRVQLLGDVFGEHLINHVH